MTRDTLHRGLAILAETFPHRQVTTGLGDAYWLVLNDLTDEEFTRAVKGCILTGKFFPAPAELREQARPAPTDAEIGRLFVAIEGSSEYDPHVGPCWSAKRIEEQFGLAAAESFRACGGSPAFRTLLDGNNRVHALRRFADAFREHWRRDDQVAILGPASAPLRELVAGLARQLSAGPDRTAETQPSNHRKQP